MNTTGMRTVGGSEKDGIVKMKELRIDVMMDFA